MNQRYATGPREVAGMNTSQLREHFLITDMMKKDTFGFTYSHFDRAIVGSIAPTQDPVELGNYANLRSGYFLERREMGIINVGGKGEIRADGASYLPEKLDAVYLGKGTEQVSFRSLDANQPALFYIFSTPAHQSHPNAIIPGNEVSAVRLGSKETANERSIYKYIYLDGKKSCQLVMGLTLLNTGSVWNTMPSHVHDRRMEAYFYFNLPDDQVVLHLMGEPQETRHLIVRNHEAILSPPWSVHSGCGTSSYGFIWAMAGENQDYSDMDPVAMSDLE